MPDAKAWREKLEKNLVPQIADNIHHFESQMELKKMGKISDTLFAETRLRLGLYGQRYDNGHRFDGVQDREIGFPNPYTKGPETHWDAPGMVRIKIPKGEVSPDQIDLMADLSEEYSDGVSHISTRQDIQLHFIRLEDTPSLMLRLAASGITTQEACGNSVRNVTTSPETGVEQDEVFNVDPYATAIFKFLLGHPDTMEFGRKFKISFSGKESNASGLTNMNDMGFLAKKETIDGKEVLGFKVLVGGGLGAVPHDAKVLYDFLPVEKILPVTQAVCRIFSRLGEKKNRALARVKFLIAKLGLETFKEMVEEELKTMRHDPKWTELIDNLEVTEENPKSPAATAPEGADEFNTWMSYNVREQKQEGYYLVTVQVPLGDLSPKQMRAIGEISRTKASDSVRFTVDQNLTLRYVSGSDLEAVYAELKALGLTKGRAGTIKDMTACPGTDTCKLGTSSSRGLAFGLQKHLEEKGKLRPEIESLKIKMSGCYNSCGQHYLADIGFYGVARKKDGRDVPHFQVVLGGRWSQEEGSYGLPITAVTSKSVPALVDKLTDHYSANREGDETFHAFIKRIGKKEAKALIEEFRAIPDYDDAPEYYQDWFDHRAYSTGDKGVGECAGEVVTLFELEIGKADFEYFDGQVALDEKKYDDAIEYATKSMLAAAGALVKVQNKDVRGDDEIRKEFSERYSNNGIFADKFARYLYDSLDSKREASDENARRTLQEAQLFIEEVHASRDRAAAAVETKTN